MAALAFPMLCPIDGGCYIWGAPTLAWVEHPKGGI